MPFLFVLQSLLTSARLQSLQGFLVPGELKTEYILLKRARSVHIYITDNQNLTNRLAMIDESCTQPYAIVR